MPRQRPLGPRSDAVSDSRIRCRSPGLGHYGFLVVQISTKCEEWPGESDQYTVRRVAAHSYIRLCCLRCAPSWTELETSRNVTPDKVCIRPRELAGARLQPDRPFYAIGDHVSVSAVTWKSKSWLCVYKSARVSVTGSLQFGTARGSRHGKDELARRLSLHDLCRSWGCCNMMLWFCKHADYFLWFRWHRLEQ